LVRGIRVISLDSYVAPAAGVAAAAAAAATMTPNCRGKENLLSFNSRVRFVGVGFIQLERVLPYNVSRAWRPSLHIFDREWWCWGLVGAVGGHIFDSEWWCWGFVGVGQ